MMNDGMELFIRWILRNGVFTEGARQFVTIATFLSDDERLIELQTQPSVAWLDLNLADELLSLATPEEAVTLLTRRIGPHLSPQAFKKVLERTLAESYNLEVVSGLMFVAGLFLERHPGAFQLPYRFIEQLLASENVDYRLAGLKAMRHTSVPSIELIARLTEALKQDTWLEKWAGLSQVRQLLENPGQRLAYLADQGTLEELRLALVHVADTAPDTDARLAAEHCVALLRRIKSE